MIHAQLLALDAANRERAIDPGSFIVEAPAGAGKTELLTQRYLALLNIVNEPEEIVAITFTNKAAAEMRSRILNSLQDAAADLPIDKPHKLQTRRLAKAALARSQTQGWQLLTQPSRLRINTIDSFSSLLARQMPLMSRFGAQLGVVEDAGMLYQEAAARALASLESADHAPVKLALQYFDNDTVRLGQQLADMLAKRDQWLLHSTQHSLSAAYDYSSSSESSTVNLAAIAERELEADGIADQAAEAFRQLIQHDINAAHRVLDMDLQRRLMPVARYAASNLPCEHPVSLLLDWETPLLPRHESLSMWLSVCDFLLTKDGDLRKEKGINARNGLPATSEGKAWKQQLVGIMATIEDAIPLARLRKLPDLRNIDEERHIVAALADLLKLAAAHLVTVFQESGEVDFTEVSQRALQALEDQSGPTDLALRLDYRIQHLLVDEFQDTSPMQVNLLQKLMSGWEPGDGRTLFCVGDPMQSIYRFRKADVGLFLQVAQFGIAQLPLENLHLTRNNRSCPEVIDWVNDAFARVFPSQDSVTRGAISYREFAATRDSLPDAGVQVHALVAAQDTEGDALAALEARRIADIIEQEQADGAALGQPRSIAVLVRARNHLHALVAEIRRNRPHLKFQAVKVEGLADRQSVQDMLSLTRALLHRADRVNWLAILRAPWCGLQLADLHVLAADDHHSTVWQLMQDEDRLARISQDGRQRLLHVRAIAAEAYAHQGRLSMRRWVESTWLKLGGPYCLWEAGDVRDVEAVLDLIDTLESSGRFDLATLETGIAKLYAAPDVHADGTLQFMTIHNSKGLEFDTVILPGLHRQSAKGDAPLILWEEVALANEQAQLTAASELGAATQLVAAPWRPKYRRDEMPSTYDYLQGLESERSANETARVLYVAATRAVRKLHLVAAIKPSSKDEVKPPNGTLLELLWDTVGGEFMQSAQSLQAETPLQIPTVPAEWPGFIPQLIRLKQPDVPEMLKGDAINTQPSADAQLSSSDAASADKTSPDAAYPDATYSEITGDDEMPSSHTLEAAIGSLAHRYMEIIAEDGLAQWPVSRLAALTAVMVHWLGAQGCIVQKLPAQQKQTQKLPTQKVLANDIQHAADRVLAVLQTALGSEDGRWLLQPRASHQAELAIARADKLLISTHVVDRTFIDDGVRWIVDYKSIALAPDLSEAAILSIARRYQAQLARYAGLFVHEGLPIKQAVFFMSIGRLVVLPD